MPHKPAHANQSPNSDFDEPESGITRRRALMTIAGGVGAVVLAGPATALASTGEQPRSVETREQKIAREASRIQRRIRGGRPVRIASDVIATTEDGSKQVPYPLVGKIEGPDGKPVKQYFKMTQRLLGAKGRSTLEVAPIEPDGFLPSSDLIPDNDGTASPNTIVHVRTDRNQLPIANIPYKDQAGITQFVIRNTPLAWEVPALGDPYDGRNPPLLPSAPPTPVINEPPRYQ